MDKNYYAIIPASVRYDKELTPNAKLLYGEITALSSQKGYCWATNAYFSKLYGVSKVSVSKWINQLISRNYLKSEMIYGTKKEILERRLYLVEPIIKNLNRELKNVYEPGKEIFDRSIKEKFKDNNTLDNNTYNITKEYSAFNNAHFKNDINFNIEEINNFFETHWKLYPNKRNKNQVSMRKKKELYILGSKLKICIERYIEDVENQKLAGFTSLKYKNGNTFFNSGYIDYLDENYLVNNKKNGGVKDGNAYGIRNDFGKVKDAKYRIPKELRDDIFG